MAKIVEDFIMVKFSKLVKDHDDESIGIDNSLRESIENAIQGVVESNIIVEIEKK